MENTYDTNKLKRMFTRIMHLHDKYLGGTSPSVVVDHHDVGQLF